MKHPEKNLEPDAPEMAVDQRAWFFKGMRGLLTLPAAILITAMVGFSGLAREAGLNLGETMFAAGAVWALPSSIVFVNAVIFETSFFALVLGVALASVRLMPMVMAIVPEMRTPETSTFRLLVASHFVAITAWVYALSQFPNIPRAGRFPFFVGFGVTLMTVATAMTGLVHWLGAAMPLPMLAGLFFLAPVYFLTSLWGSSRFDSDKLAMIFGLILGPVFHILMPEFDLLIAGIIGGLLAYFLRNRIPSILADTKQ